MGQSMYPETDPEGHIPLVQAHMNQLGETVPPHHLKVATYNIHRSIGSDGLHDPLRSARVIRETGAAILALQEVEDHSHDPDALARATGTSG